MTQPSQLTASLVLVVVTVAPAFGQQASLELVAQFHHLMNRQLRHEFCLEPGSYVAAAKALYTRSGDGGVEVYLAPKRERPNASKRVMWLFVEGDDDYDYGTFYLTSAMCITVESTFAYGRIYRLHVDPAPWSERPERRPPFPPAIPPPPPPSDQSTR